MSQAAHCFTNLTIAHSKLKTLCVGNWRHLFKTVEDASAMFGPTFGQFSIERCVPQWLNLVAAEMGGTIITTIAFMGKEFCNRLA